MTPITMTARDGRSLAGLLVESDAPRGALVVNSATGIPREFYLKFAQYAAQRGYHSLAYDYRGIGASRCEPLRADPARMSDWAVYDMPAALEWLEWRFPGIPLFTVGHSVGGQLIGCMYNQARARAHVLIAASTGYWRFERAPFRYQALLFWLAHGNGIDIHTCQSIPEHGERIAAEGTVRKDIECEELQMHDAYDGWCLFSEFLVT